MEVLTISSSYLARVDVTTAAAAAGEIFEMIYWLVHPFFFKIQIGPVGYSKKRWARFGGMILRVFFLRDP